jgi:hypothetical protein
MAGIPSRVLKILDCFKFFIFLGVLRKPSPTWDPYYNLKNVVGKLSVFLYGRKAQKLCSYCRNTESSLESFRLL